MSNLFPIRDYIAANSDNPDELRARWAAETKLKEKESIPVQTATSTWLETRVATKLAQFVEAREEAAREAKRAKQRADEEMEKLLEKQLGSFVMQVGGHFYTGRAHFSYKGHAYAVYLQDGQFWLDDGKAPERVDNAIPGSFTDRIIHLFAKREDF
jgi:enterochelin esterase-like enzyme